MEGEHPGHKQRPGWLRLYKELRRRKVVRIAVVYFVVGWVVIQVASVTFTSFGIPDWGSRLIIWLIALGFPVALVLAWAFEQTRRREPRHGEIDFRHCNATICAF